MAQPALTLDDLPLPRRVAIAELVGAALSITGELALLYAALAARGELAALDAGLGELAWAKGAEAAALESLARDLGCDAAQAAPAPRLETGAAGRGQVFTRAFERERTLEITYRELVALLAGHPLEGRLARLAAETAGHRARLRDLYWRYS